MRFEDTRYFLPDPEELKHTRIARTLLNVNQLGAGEEGEIVMNGETDFRLNRLREIGFIPGHVVKMVRPGNPAIIEVIGTRYAIRREDMRQILVRPIESSDAKEREN